MNSNHVTSNRANETVDSLHYLARQIDADYSEACADTSNTNAAPVGERQALVSLLHSVALMLNASGLCDSGEYERFINYAADHGHKINGLA